MQDWLDPGRWQLLWQDLQLWWSTRVVAGTTLAQLAAIGAIFLLARLVAPRLRWLMKRLETGAGRVPAFSRVLTALGGVATPLSWLILQWLAIVICRAGGWPHHLLTTTASLLGAWVVIHLASNWIRNEFWSRLVALSAWTIAALNILGLLPATAEILDSLAINAGALRISALTVIQGGLTLGLLLWLAVGLAGLIDRRLRTTKAVSPAARVLMGKLARIGLVTAAILFSLNSLGIDLTALAVVSGALAVGLGFGLQKIFSNLVSGVILLLDKSIKPGDVIAVGQTYGWIDHLGARYASVVTRDGVEHLIPNEELITQRVENWSHSNNLVRLRVPVGVSYRADPRFAMRLCVEAAEMVPRVLLDPAPRCLMTAYGASSVDLEVRVWINDPENGRGAVISDVLLEIWDRFHENGIEIPFPQQDLHLRTMLGSEAADIFAPAVVAGRQKEDAKKHSPGKAE